ncbi:MAG: hypothetical protein VX527_11640 [Planctomycetota bacterium]|nr:hypothetical protein [Planctomycetota bacterium]
MNRYLTSSVLCSIGIVGLMVSQGCNPRPTLRPETAKALYEISKANMTTRDGTQQTFSAMDWSLGTIPSNDQALPLNSPDGQWLAVKTGPTVAMSTLLALPDAPIPLESGVEIWKVDPTTATIALHSMLPPPLLLGQSADADGFLVELPQENGSRWLGKADWDTGAITWLAQDNAVNTYGSLGPNGELAWCTRPISETAFSLAIRFPDDEEVGIGPNGGEWLMPSWSTRTSRLSVFFLSEDGILSILSFDAQTPRMVAEPPHRFDLMTGARRLDVLHARSGQPVIQGTPPPPLEEVIFYHPVAQSIYVWLPTSLLKKPPFGLSSDSIVATKDHLSQGYLVGTNGDLRWQNPDDRQGFVRVRYGSTIPRVTTSQIAPYLLFVPGMGEIEVRAMVPQKSIPAPTTTAEAPVG